MSEQPTFRRQVIFRPGYNYLHETGPTRRGQHGMSIMFFLHGPDGSTVFTLGTSWTPPGPVDEDKVSSNQYHPEPVHCDVWRGEDYGLGLTRFGYVRPPSGFDLGYHWKTPLYPEQEEYARDDCPFIEGRCYYDGSGLHADRVMKEFIVKGERVVWKHLVERYRWCLDEVETSRG